MVISLPLCILILLWIPDLFFIKNRCCLYINIAIQKILSRKNDILPPRRVHFKHPFKKQNYSQNNSLTNSLHCQKEEMPIFQAFEHFFKFYLISQSLNLYTSKSYPHNRQSPIWNYLRSNHNFGNPPKPDCCNNDNSWHVVYPVFA